MSILYNMTIFSVYPIEIITGEWGAIQILPVPCPPLIAVALYYSIDILFQYLLVSPLILMNKD